MLSQCHTVYQGSCLCLNQPKAYHHFIGLVGYKGHSVCLCVSLCVSVKQKQKTTKNEEKTEKNPVRVHALLLY